jgi:hypothetical protein
MNGLLTENVQVQLGSDLVADTTNATNSAIEDMEGFDEITFLVKFGDVDNGAILTLNVKENSASSTSSPTPTNIALTKASAGTITSGNLVLTNSPDTLLDDKIVAITVKRQAMSKRYVYLNITVASESYEIDAIITLKSCPRGLPVTQPSDVYSVASAAA